MFRFKLDSGRGFRETQALGNLMHLFLYKIMHHSDSIRLDFPPLKNGRESYHLCELSILLSSQLIIKHRNIIIQIYP